MKSINYAVIQNSRFPSKFDGKVDYPSKIKEIRQAQDDFFVHVGVKAGFEKSSEQLSQVYVSLKRKAPGSVQINAYGKYNKESGLFEATFDASKDFDQHFNGDYEVHVHAADYRGDAPVSWNAGQVKIWYKEGLEEGVNNGVRADYRPLPTIEFSFPPTPAQISLALPLVGCGLLGVLFFQFLMSGLFGNRANLSKMSFMGLLFSGSIALVLVIFGAFFVEVKLIPTLWLLLFISPVILMIGQRALSQADCTVPEWRGGQAAIAPKAKKE